ncbi:MAG: prephenate dehydratase [Alphaproteobacteria bacterium]|nr:prephenate dehydratase [Alphaproteobacteria bacterium]
MPTVAFQGQPGAYSHLACRESLPDHTTVACESFEDAFESVVQGRADVAMIPIENSVAGRVADVHHLLPETDLNIVAEHFQAVRHCLLAPRGARLDGVRTVHSHVQALGQCRRYLREHKLRPTVHADTAGAAAEVARLGDPTRAAIASSLAAEFYGLDILEQSIEDAHHNTTRFVVLAREPADPDPESGLVMTSFVFQVRNVPAALYKALGGFATNRVNMVKLESYMLDGSFSATQFYADIEGHPATPSVRLAFEELGFFSRRVKVLGVYPANPFRSRGG